MKTMGSELAKIIHGEMPANFWDLNLTLSQGMDDGSSHGTRTYNLVVHEHGLRMACHGTEWQRGEGSDSWMGATFDYRLHQSKNETDDIYDFMGEFRQAVSDADYVLSISLNEETIGDLAPKGLVKQWQAEMKTHFGEELRHLTPQG